MKKFLLIILLFCLSIIQIHATEVNDKILPSAIGKVENVEYIDTTEEGSPIQTKQIAQVKILNGTFKNTDLPLENIFTGNPHYDINLRKGMKVILHVEDSNNGLNISVEDISRSQILVWLSLLFCGLLIYVGKKKGIYSLVAIALTCILIFNILSPAILHGFNPILVTMFVCLLSTIATMYFVGGFNKKSTSATLGCMASIATAGFLSFITVKIAYLNGFGTENMMYLYSSHPELNFEGIIISSMLLATLGAVMDVAMSIASTINEIYCTNYELSLKELFNSGMNVGKDIIGTMANTLILVYLGGALPLLLLANNIDFQKFINLNQVVTELSSALIGSSAIVFCVPLTAIISALFIKGRSKTTNNKIN